MASIRSYPRMAICGCTDHPQIVTIGLQINRVFDSSLPKPLVHGERICLSVISRSFLPFEPAIQAGHEAFRLSLRICYSYKGSETQRRATAGQDCQNARGKQDEDKKEDSQLLKSVKDSTKLAAEVQHGLIAQALKDVLFSSWSG
ncbi:hypothetical protein DFH11DRAFT_1643380 [Phellopilus nigrolimitatus]|nr:hypothetical protein DFH11DRAFT_1643380 [Phellopilus nigrolimitatus]